MTNLYLANIILYAITHPKAGKHLIKAKYHSWQDSKKSNSLFDYGKNKSEIEKILQSIFLTKSYSIEDLRKDTKHLQNHIFDFLAKINTENYPSKKKPYPIDYNLDNQSGMFLYALCKIIQPEIIVETGVAYGLSSLYILQALHENNKGVLYSIDYLFTPWQTKEMIGSAIPRNLRDKWRFIYGPSSEMLPKVLSSVNKVDVFFHDSLHTYKNMKYEFETAWPYIKNNGLLVSDDIVYNNAFYDFCSSRKLESFILQQNSKSFLGIIKKP
ncbi:MAG: class I SAM-dependent methyltransferase [Nitrososphaerota archaeon]